MRWQRMPATFGPYWFTPKLEGRDWAALVRVSRYEYGDGSVEFRRRDGDAPITPGEGWWLLIPDHRKTAEIEGGK